MSLPQPSSQVNLADNFQLKLFVTRLEKCESIPDNLLSQWESDFIADMREKFETRENAFDLGIDPWSPTVRMMNQLNLLREKAL